MEGNDDPALDVAGAGGCQAGKTHQVVGRRGVGREECYSSRHLRLGGLIARPLRREHVYDVLDAAPAVLAEFIGSHGHQEASGAEAPQQRIVIDDGAQSFRNAARQCLGSRPAQ